MSAADRQNRRALALFAQHGRTPRTALSRDWGNLNRTRPGEELLPVHQVEHGDSSMYRHHVRNGEPACALCAETHKREVEDSRRRRTEAA